MRLATPISHLFRDEAAGRRIAAASDCLECREWCIESEWPRQELIHYDLGIQLPWGDAVRRELAHAFSLKHELRLVTFQVPSCYDAPVIEGRCFQPGGRRLGRAEMLEAVRENGGWLRTVLPAAVRVGLENNNYYPTPAYEDVTDPSFVTEAVEALEGVFLLDIAHAYISAHNRGERTETYMAGLPLSRLAQVHLCGPVIPADGMAYDAHEWPSEPLTAEALRLGRAHGAEYLTVEYYKDTDRLVGGLEALRKRLAADGGET